MRIGDGALRSCRIDTMALMEAEMGVELLQCLSVVDVHHECKHPTEAGTAGTVVSHGRTSNPAEPQEYNFLVPFSKRRTPPFCRYCKSRQINTTVSLVFAKRESLLLHSRLHVAHKHPPLFHQFQPDLLRLVHLNWKVAGTIDDMLSQLRW